MNDVDKKRRASSIAVAGARLIPALLIAVAAMSIAAATGCAPAPHPAAQSTSAIPVPQENPAPPPIPTGDTTGLVGVSVRTDNGTLHTLTASDAAADAAIPQVAALDDEGSVTLLNAPNGGELSWRRYGPNFDPSDLVVGLGGDPGHRLAGTSDGTSIAMILPRPISIQGRDAVSGDETELTVLRTDDWSARTAVIGSSFRPTAIAIGSVSSTIYLAGPNHRGGFVVERYDIRSLAHTGHWAFSWPSRASSGIVEMLSIDRHERTLYISYGAGADRLDLAGDSVTLCRRAEAAACIAGIGPAAAVDDRVLIAADPAPRSAGGGAQAGDLGKPLSSAAMGRALVTDRSGHTDTIATPLGPFVARRSGAAVPVFGVPLTGGRFFASAQCPAPVRTNYLVLPRPDSTLPPGLFAVGLGVPQEPSLFSREFQCATQIAVSADGNWIAILQRDLTTSGRFPSSWVAIVDARTGRTVRQVESGSRYMDLWCCVPPRRQ